MLTIAVQAERARISSKQLQSLQDEIDELKVERDGLAKKANTVDKYKQKLQASQHLKNENELLRAEIEDIRQNSRHTADNQEQLDSLGQTVDEYKGILPRIEQECHELRMMKGQLEIDNAALVKRWKAANEQRARDQETIEELRIELRDAESGADPSIGSAGGLDAELAETAEKDSKLQVAIVALSFSRYLNKSRKTRISELENEITQLKTNSPATDAQNLEDKNRLQGQLVDTQRELARSEAKLNDQIDQYAALCELEHQTYRTNKVLQNKAEGLLHELKVQKDILHDALGADEKMSKTSETSTKIPQKTLETLKLIKSAARTRSEGPTPGSTEYLERLMASYADEIMSGADTIAKRTEVQKKLSLEPSGKTKLPKSPTPSAVSQHVVTAPAIAASQRWSILPWAR